MRTSTLRSSTELLIAVAAALAVLLGAHRIARADSEEIDLYREAVARGAKRFQDGEYHAARREFQLAYDIHAEPILLFNIASTHRRQGNDDLALAYYRRFLAEADDGDSRRALAIKTIAELEARMDREARAESQSADPARKPAARGRRVVKRLAAQPAPSRGPERPTGNVMRWTGVAAGAVALTSFAFAWQATREARGVEQYLESLPSDQAWDQAQVDAYNHGQAASRRAIIFSVAGGALATTGVVLFVVGQHRANQAEVAVTPESGGAGLVMKGRF
jgi:hypothetical protein